MKNKALLTVDLFQENYLSVVIVMKMIKMFSFEVVTVSTIKIFYSKR